MHDWIEVDIYGIEKAKEKLEKPQKNTGERINHLENLLEEIQVAKEEINDESDDAIYELNELADNVEADLEAIE